MSFREDYLRFKQPSVKRENFIFESIKKYLNKQNIVSSMKPITILKNGLQVTYYVMPDYLSIDNIRLPMSAITAQKVADYFGLSLPSAEISREIYENSDVKFIANPLSNSGANINGQKYTGKQVVDKGVGYADFAVSYNEKINKQISEKRVKKDQIISGFAKDITSAIPGYEKKLGLYGFFDAKGKPIQGGNGKTPHDISTHTEYGAFVRLISPDAEITYANGKKEKKPISSLYQISSYKDPSKNTEIVNEERLQDINMDNIDFFLKVFKISSLQRRFNLMKRMSKIIY